MRTLIISLSLALLFLGGTSGHAEEPSPTVFAVVVSNKANVANISMAELRRLYVGGVLTDDEGRKLVPINLRAKTPLRVEFDRHVLGKEPDRVGRFWIDRKIRGKGGPPRAVLNPDLALRFVSAFPVAVGYVPADAVRGGVRVLAIDGKFPGDPDYPLEVSP